jgi:hypothetical protein
MAFHHRAISHVVRRLQPACSLQGASRPVSLFLLCAAVFAVLLGVHPVAQGQQLQVLQNHVRPQVLDRRAALVGAMPADQQLHVSIVLPLRNRAGLTSLLGRLYDPSSTDYRHFLSVAQFTEQFGPSDEDFQAVAGFAQANGLTVTELPANRLIVPVTGTVAQMNAAFHIQINVYQHPTENRTFFSPDREPSLNLSAAVSHIAGLDDFSLPHHMSLRGPTGQLAATVSGSGPGGSYLGSDMRAAYYGGTTLDGNGQTVGILEFGGYSLSDVNLTFSNAGQSYKVPINNVLLDGASAGPSGSDAEQVLDIVQAIGMAPGLSQVRVYIGYGLDDPHILNSMATENIAKQISCSWSWRPADPTVDDVFFQEMAAQGQSFFTASGDSGAFDAAISPFFYPGDDQLVTAGTGGGISPDNISIPSWQVGLATSANGGSGTLRNVPDVAMEGDFDNYACGGGACSPTFAGTSFAAPRWAGFMALVNQQAVESGNAPSGGLGFINPALYRLAQAAASSADFHDITVGNNDTANQPQWFSAVVGYDLTTGWGSANGQKLIDDLAGPQVPGFWLSSSQSSVGINPGSTGTATMNLTNAGGFNGSISLAVSSALPTGVTAAFSPNPATGSSVLTLTASSSAPSANQTVTITGTSGTLTASTNITVGVHAPSFTLIASPSIVGINQGASGTSTIFVQALYGFADTVNLSIAGLPAGVTAAFSPASTTGTSTLTLTASSTATPGTTSLTVTGTSGTLTATSTVSLSIHGPSFLLSGPSSVSVGQGSNATSYVYVIDQYGFTGNVNLAVSGLPNGVTAAFTPNPTTGTSTLTFTASSSASLGQSTITITGTSGALSATINMNLGVYAPTFTISGSSGMNIGQGSSGSSYIYVSPQYGFTGSVNLSVAGLPSGVTAVWTPNPTVSNSTLTLFATSAAKVGQYSLTITGVSGSQTATTAFTLGIYAPTFTLSSGTLVNIGQGNSGSTYVYVTPQYGFTASVNLAVTGLPSGVTATFSANPTNGSSTLSLQASSTAALGQYTVVITGTSGTQTATSTLTLGVYVPTFTLANYGGVTVGQGNSSYGYVYVTPQYGFTGSVTMSVSGLPSGVTATFSPNPTTGNSTLTFNASSTAAVGQYVLTVTGTSGTQTAFTTLTLGIYKPTFTLYGGGSVTLGQGTTASTYVGVNALYGFAGSVSMSVTGLPSGVTAAFSPNPTTGSSTLILTASSTASLGQYTLTITGTSGSATATANVTLGVYVPTFSLSGPYNMTAGQGTSSSGYVFVSSQYGFTGGVNLSVSGLPSGVTGSFSPNPTTSSSTLLLNVGASAPVGTSTVTMTGTSGSQTVTSTFLLTIYAPSFTLYNSTPSLSLNDGASGTASITIYPQYGFSGAVTLSATGLPSGVTASFSPNPATGTSLLTLTASSTAAAGQTTVTITGTSGSLTASTSLTLTVYAPSFTLTAAPAAVFLFPGGTGKSTVSVVAQHGFAGSVSYAASGVPSGVTASFSPNPTAGSSTLTLTAAANAAPVSGTVTITGTSGSLTATVALAVTVRGAQTATATTLALGSGGNPVSTVARGTPVTATATVTAGTGALTTGQVNFCDATATLCDALHLLGTAQLTSAGTAVVAFLPGSGSHSYKAMFAGTNANAASTSAAANIAVTASQVSATTIAQSGSAGNYTLTATVTGQGPMTPAGNVSFLDTTNSNLLLASAALSSGPTTYGLSTTQSPAAGTQPQSVATGDFNGDGIPDLAVVNYGSNSISIFLGKGDGTFTAANSLTTGSGPAAIVAGDFNRDGHLDLAVTLGNSAGVTIFLGNGDGTFTVSNASAPTGLQPAGMALGDFNGDGLLDLAVANDGSSTVTILLGNGDGTFTSASSSQPVGNYPRAIGQGDFNGDGVQDLAVVNQYGGTVSILLGVGDGTFTLAGTAATGSYPTSIATGDLNGDGKLDLAISNEYGNSITVLLGNGDGTFTAAANANTGSYPMAVAMVDLNGDGKADLVTANYYNSNVTVLLGNGDGTFGAGVSFATGTYPIALAVGDWNGDGIRDIAVANTGNNTLTILTTQLSQRATASASGISPIGVGQHAVDAAYAGNSIFTASTSGTTMLSGGAGPPAVTVSLSPGSITTIQALTVSIAVSGGGANAVPTGSVQISSGGYTSATTTLSGGTAAIAIPGGTLPVGTDLLTVRFTPDSASTGIYTAATGSASITVGSPTPVITWATPAAIAYGTALGSAQLNATSSVAGTFAYIPAAGTVLAAGNQILRVTFTPADLTAYTTVVASVTLAVSQAAPTISWPTPSAITYGTALSSTQLNATASVAGTFAYIPAAGTVLAAGSQTLRVTFTPTDTADYSSVSASVTLSVNVATPAVTWSAPAAITYGTALSSAQLNASSTVAGSFSYSPAAGTVPAAGAQSLRVTFTPTDSSDYAAATSTVTLTVNKAALSLSAANAARTYGTANPAFTGAVTGAVNGDTFTETFSTSATVSSTVGTYAIVPAVAGASVGNYTMTPTNGVLTIAPAATTSSLALSNGNLTFTSTVAPAASGVPTGSVSFYAGQTLLGTGTLTNGVASYTATAFPTGNVTLTAQYSGDANFTQSTSASVAVLTVTPGSPSVSVSQAGVASDVFTFAVAPGYAGTLQFNCNGLPQYAACTFVSPSVVFTGGASSASSTLTIHTGGVASLSLPPSPFGESRSTPWAAALGLPGLLALALAARRRKVKIALPTMVLLLLLCGAASSLGGCAGSSSQPGSSSGPPTSTGVYTIQVVTSGPSGLTQTTNLSVTVQ